VTPEIHNEMESSTTSDAWETSAVPDAWEPSTISSELEPSTAFDGIEPSSTSNAWESNATSSEAEASTTTNWRDKFQSTETSNIDEKPTPTTSTDDNYKDQQIAGILRTIAGIINEDSSGAYSSFLSSSPAVETKMPMKSALVEEKNSNTPSYSTTGISSEAGYTDPANAAYEPLLTPGSSINIDSFESESSTSPIVYGEPQEAPIAINAFSSAAPSLDQKSSAPQPSSNIHIPAASEQMDTVHASATPLPSGRILAPAPANPAPSPSIGPDAKDPKASPPPGDKPSSSPAPGKDAAKPTSSPASGNPPTDTISGGGPLSGKAPASGGPGDGSSPGSPPSKPNSPPGGGTPGGNRGGPSIDYGGPFSGGQGKSDSSSGNGKTTDEDLGAIGQIGVFESSASSQHMALASVWMWIVALVVIWTTLRHRE
jgi:hypothetical protein